MSDGGVGESGVGDGDVGGGGDDGRAAGYDEAALRERYGPIAGRVRADPEQFARLDRWLKQARVGTPVDEYVQRSAWLGVYAAIAGICLGALLAIIGAVASVGSLAVWVALPLVFGLLGGGGMLGVRYGYPAVVAHQRRRHIDLLLPHATMFLYALSHGGMDLYEVIGRVADADEVYGEVAAEFALVEREMERFDQDLFGALATVRELTPSDDLRTFLDELLAVLETGGDVDDFLHDEARRHRELAESHQEQLLDDLGTMAEVYVAAVFAGPTFLLVVLLVASFVVPGLLIPMQLLVYLGLPAAVIWFSLCIDYLLEPYRQHVGRSGSDSLLTRARAIVRSWRGGTGVDGAEAAEAAGIDAANGDADTDARIERYREATRRSAVERFRAAPVATMRDRPGATLLVSVPLGALAVVGLLAVGIPELRLLDEDPVLATSTLFAVPFLIAAVPFAYFQHLKRSHDRTIRDRFPDALDIVADADENEVPLDEAFGLVARRTSGPLEAELERLDRDLRWTNDVVAALDRLADRVAVPAIERISYLLQESIRATNDLAPVFRVVAEDLDTRNDVRQRQRRNMRPYVLVVFIGVFVYLGIVVVFDTHFLPVAAEVAETSTESLQRAPLQVGDVPTTTYRRLFFHSALIQAVGNGLLLGVLTDNRVTSGVGYAAALVAVALTVFLAFV